SVLPTWATPPTPWPCAAKPVWRDDPWPNLGSARAPEGRLDGGRRIGARRPGGVAPAVRGRAGLAIRPVGHSRRAVPRPHGRTPRQYSDPGVRRHGPGRPDRTGGGLVRGAQRPARPALVARRRRIAAGRARLRLQLCLVLSRACRSEERRVGKEGRLRWCP